MSQHSPVSADTPVDESGPPDPTTVTSGGDSRQAQPAPGVAGEAPRPRRRRRRPARRPGLTDHTDSGGETPSGAEANTERTSQSQPGALGGLGPSARATAGHPTVQYRTGSRAAPLRARRGNELRGRVMRVREGRIDGIRARTFGGGGISERAADHRAEVGKLRRKAGAEALCAGVGGRPGFRGRHRGFG